MSVPKHMRATTPEELAVADENGHVPFKRKVTLREIREVWLYGRDGVTPMNEQDLQELTGATTAQIHRNYPELKTERENLFRNMLVASKKDVSSVMVNEKHLDEHERMVDVLKDQLDEVELELLVSVVGTRDHKNLLNMWLSLKEKWEKDTGVDSVRAAMAQMVKDSTLEKFDKSPNSPSGLPVGGIAKDGSKRLKGNSSFDS